MFRELDSQQRQRHTYPFENNGRMDIELGGETYEVKSLSIERIIGDEDEKLIRQVDSEFLIPPGVIGGLKCVPRDLNQGDYLWDSRCAYHIGGKFVEYKFQILATVDGTHYGVLTITDSERVISQRMISISKKKN